MINPKINFIVFSLFFISLLSPWTIRGQVINTCTPIISGQKHGHLFGITECDIQIQITSTIEDPITIFTGGIESTESIRITPGENKVILLPIDTNQEENLIENHEHPKFHTATHLKVKKPPTSGRFSEFKSQKTKSISISPNPTNGLIAINMDEKIKSILIYDLYATLLLEKTIKGSSKTQITADLSQFKKGFYIIKISLENGETLTKTIIKN